MDLPEPLKSRMAEALRPTSSDVMTARELMLDKLRNGRTVNERGLLELVCARVGVDPHTPRGEELQVTGRGEDATADLTSALIVRERLRLAVSEAIAELRAHGLITEVTGHEQPNVSIPAHQHGSRSGAHFSLPHPATHGTYRLLRPYIHQPDLQFFDPDLFSRSAEELLGPRGRRCVSEAIAAHHHGLYLTAANMLGAAGEAAWFAVGELLRDREARSQTSWTKTAPSRSSASRPTSSSGWPSASAAPSPTCGRTPATCATSATTGCTRVPRRTTTASSRSTSRAARCCSLSHAATSSGCARYPSRLVCCPLPPRS